MSTGISVIIPTYNRVSVIQRALDSVFRQTFPPTEVIVIDDGSMDETAAMITTNYPAVRLLSQKNMGISAARNAGIRMAKADWLALLDSDDEWLADKLQQQMQALQENPHYLFCHTNETWIRNGLQVKQMKKHHKYGGHIFRHCLPLCVISPSSAIIHRSVFAKVGLFDETLPVCEDYDMWLRICARYPVLFLDSELIIKYGGHADQLSRRYWGMDRFRIRALEKILSDPELSVEHKKTAFNTMREKLQIVLKGARKYQNHELVSKFEPLLARQISEYEHMQT